MGVIESGTTVALIIMARTVYPPPSPAFGGVEGKLHNLTYLTRLKVGPPPRFPPLGALAHYARCYNVPICIVRALRSPSRHPEIVPLFKL